MFEDDTLMPQIFQQKRYFLLTQVHISHISKIISSSEDDMILLIHFIWTLISKNAIKLTFKSFNQSCTNTDWFFFHLNQVHAWCDNGWCKREVVSQNYGNAWKMQSPNGLSPWQHSTCAVFMIVGNESTGQQETIPEYSASTVTVIFASKQCTPASTFHSNFFLPIIQIKYHTPLF